MNYYKNPRVTKHNKQLKFNLVVGWLDVILFAIAVPLVVLAGAFLSSLV